MSEEELGTAAATRVQEAAANVQQVTRGRRRITGDGVESLARRYFEAISTLD